MRNYRDTLQERPNPGHLNKGAFAASVHSLNLDSEWCRNVIEGVRKGLEHIHGLGIVHDDLNPANIMFDDDDVPKITGFGSCRRVGGGLDDAGRKYEWHDEENQANDISNDLEALAEISAWLHGDVDAFKFDECGMLMLSPCSTRLRKSTIG